MIHDLLSIEDSPRRSHSKWHWNSVESAISGSQLRWCVESNSPCCLEAMHILYPFEWFFGIIRVGYQGTIHLIQSSQINMENQNYYVELPSFSIPRPCSREASVSHKHCPFTLYRRRICFGVVSMSKETISCFPLAQKQIRYKHNPQ